MQGPHAAGGDRLGFVVGEVLRELRGRRVLRVGEERDRGVVGAVVADAEVGVARDAQALDVQLRRAGGEGFR